MGIDRWILKKMRRIGRQFGLDLIDIADPSELYPLLARVRDERHPNNDDWRFLRFMLGNCLESRAQLFQDLFALFMHQGKLGGYFVEFGAADGMGLSNTYLLEKLFGWQGIVAEPARCWHERLKLNRRCVVDDRCVWSRTGEILEFREVEVPELSTLVGFTDRDGHVAARVSAKTYSVSTVSLTDLLKGNQAPRVIDYLSVDTEGSEVEILQAFDFDEYEVDLITVEHNFSASRGQLSSLLKSKGYEQMFRRFSRWDDWYASHRLLKRRTEQGATQVGEGPSK